VIIHLLALKQAVLSRHLSQQGGFVIAALSGEIGTGWGSMPDAMLS
jgi:hypothetical protein